MDEILQRRFGESWPERLVWRSFGAGAVAILLIGLLLWVERLDGGRPDVAAPPGAVAEARAVRVEIVGAGRAPEVPLQAVLRDRELAPFCWVVERRGRVRTTARRGLELGAVSGGRVRVRAGLHRGEAVVVRGQYRLHAGQVVRVLD